jgi:hypothetical protein
MMAHQEVIFMAVSVQELYQQAAPPLPESERLTLAALILQEISQSARADRPARKGDIRKFFGVCKGGDANGSDNEQIDRDLARAYAHDCEDES